MITHENGLFHLKNENLSLLFRVTRYGLLEQLQFGAPVEDGDAEALACRPGLGWGSFISAHPWKTAMQRHLPAAPERAGAAACC